MKVQDAHHCGGRCCDPAAIAAVAALYDLVVLDSAEVRAARDLASRLVVGEVAPSDAFWAVQTKAVAAVFGYIEDGEITGVLAAFSVNERGFEQLKSGAFDALDLDLSLIAAPGEKPAAHYGWGFAAANHAAGRAVVKASAHIHRELFWATPTFARAVTGDGHRALTAIGFSPSPGGGDAQLLWIAPQASNLSR